MLLSLFFCTTWLGCSEDPDTTPDGGTVDGGTTRDAGSDAGLPPVDAGTDAGTDPVDSGTDAGTDPVDSGTDAGTDPVDSGTDGGTDPADSGTDGGPGPADSGVDAGADAGPPDNAVHIRRFRRFYTASGVTEVPEDFAKNPVELFVLDGDTFVSIPGEAAGPGEYVFPDVPRTRYYVKAGREYVVTDARELDLSINSLGRADAGFVTPPEQGDVADLNLTGLEPWREPAPPSNLANPFPELKIVSGEVDFAATLSPVTTQDGDVSIVEQGMAVFNEGTGGVPIFEEARGDRAWVVQRAARDLGPLPDGGVQRYLTSVRSAHLAPFSYDGTAPMPIQGTLEALPLREQRLDWRVSDFAALAAETHPSATLRQSSFSLNPAAHGTPEGWVGWSGELLTLYRPRGEPSNVQATLVYGNPFPSNWGLVAIASTNFGVPFQLPNGPSVVVTGGFSVTDRAAVLEAGPIAPTLRAPRALSLDGTSAYEPRELAVGSHRLEWLPPTNGAGDLYYVRVRRFEFLDETFAIPTPVATFYVDSNTTSLLLPPTLFEPGTSYFIYVDAIKADGYRVTDRPLTLVDLAVQRRASTLTGLLTVPAPAP